MTTLLARIDDTRSHLARESASMVSRTRRAGFDLARAVRAEADAWLQFLEGRQRSLRDELAGLTPKSAERALLRAADGALDEARALLQARLRTVESELRRARRKTVAAAPTRAKKPARARARARRSSAGE